jgi:glycosyltransferase involved in cell wall biosynthesis
MFGIAPGQRVVLFFGTITKYKGLEDLIRAFPAVHEATGARLVVAGFPAKDVDANALKALAAELGIAEHVAWFLDYVPIEWVATLMAISAVVVLPYRAITQSAVLHIAYACGRPVVAHASAACRMRWR